jgi:hypothetical protein
MAQFQRPGFGLAAVDAREAMPREGLLFFPAAQRIAPRYENVTHEMVRQHQRQFGMFQRTRGEQAGERIHSRLPVRAALCGRCKSQGLGLPHLAAQAAADAGKDQPVGKQRDPEPVRKQRPAQAISRQT